MYFYIQWLVAAMWFHSTFVERKLREKMKKCFATGYRELLKEEKKVKIETTIKLDWLMSLDVITAYIVRNKLD